MRSLLHDRPRAVVGCFAAFVVAVLITTSACGGDDEGSGGGNGNITTSTNGSPTAEAGPTEEFFSAAASAPREPSPTGTLLDDPSFTAELQETVRINQSIASELNGLSDTYDVTPQDVAEIYDIACKQGVRPAIDRISAQIPGADMRALPALNRLVSEVALDCSSEDPRYVDTLSRAVFAFLVENTEFVPDPVAGSEPSSTLSALYKGGCFALKKGIAKLISKAFDLPRPTYALTLAVGSAMTTCPQYLEGTVGRQLEQLIAGGG